MRNVCLLPAALLCLISLPVLAASGVDPARVQQIAAMLQPHPAGFGRPITDRAAWDRVAKEPDAADVLKRAQGLLKQPLPAMTDDVYLSYSRTGSRTEWQRVAGRRRGRIGPYVRAECIENAGRYLPAFEELVRSLCAERTWVMPPHDSGLNDFNGRTVTIDLGSSDLAWQLATADYVLGPRLHPEVRALIRDNVRRRVLDPYLSMVRGERRPLWWMNGRNNWNAVCHAGVVGAALAQVESPEERALFIAAAEHYVRAYLDGISDDGYVSEGVGYWNYGFGHYLALAEEIHQATGGGVDLMAPAKVRAIAAYGSRMEIVGGVYPAFADCRVGERPDSRTLTFACERIGLGLPSATRLVARPYDSLATALMYGFPNSVSGTKARLSDAPQRLRDWFPDAGVLVCRPAAGTRGAFGVALKGGNNGENHNHNDVGSFVVVSGGRAVLLDPGSEVYTARTFSRDRYKSPVLNSFGHPVPAVAGRLQRTGADARGRVVRSDFTDAQDTLVLDIASAYDVPSLSALTRTFVYSRDGDGALTVTDEVAFKSPQTFGTALITMGKWETLGPAALRVEDKGAAVRVDIDARGARFAVKSEPLKADLHGAGTATRIGIYLTEPVTDAAIYLTISPLTDAPAQDN